MHAEAANHLQGTLYFRADHRQWAVSENHLVRLKDDGTFRKITNGETGDSGRWSAGPGRCLSLNWEAHPCEVLCLLPIRTATMLRNADRSFTLHLLEGPTEWFMRSFTIASALPKPHSKRPRNQRIQAAGVSWNAEGLHRVCPAADVSALARAEDAGVGSLQQGPAADASARALAEDAGVGACQQGGTTSSCSRDDGQLRGVPEAAFAVGEAEEANADVMTSREVDEAPETDPTCGRASCAPTDASTKSTASETLSSREDSESDQDTCDTEVAGSQGLAQATANRMASTLWGEMMVWLFIYQVARRKSITDPEFQAAARTGALLRIQCPVLVGTPGPHPGTRTMHPQLTRAPAETEECGRTPRSKPAAAVPEIIWTYWDQGAAKLPPFNRLCTRTWLARSPRWELRIVDRASVCRWLVPGEDLPNTFHKLELPQHRADCVKLALLRRRGGVYLDSSIILFDEIPNIVDWQQIQDGEVDFAGFNFRSTHHVENWFLACRQGCPFIESWHREQKSFWEGRTVAQDIERDEFFKGVDLTHIQSTERDYLVQHACYKKLVDMDVLDASRSRIQPAEDYLWFNRRVRELARKRHLNPPRGQPQYPMSVEMEWILNWDEPDLAHEVLRRKYPLIKITGHLHVLQTMSCHDLRGWGNTQILFRSALQEQVVKKPALKCNPKPKPKPTTVRKTACARDPMSRAGVPDKHPQYCKILEELESKVNKISPRETSACRPLESSRRTNP